MSRKTLALTATIIGSGMAVLDGFVVTLALPRIGADLHSSLSDFQWIVDGFLLSLSSLILIGGALGDIIGRKRVYLIGLSGFVVFSMLCGVAPDNMFLIIMRVLQGAFGALLVPSGLAIINTNFEPAERGRAIGAWSAWTALVAPLGPVVGGFIISAASWRWVFYINLPLGIICWWLASRNFQESKSRAGRRLDYPGALITVLSLAGITYGLIEGPANHWHLGSLVPLIVGLILLPVFIWWEKRAKDPLISLDLFASRNFSGSNIMTFAQYGALGGFTFALPIYLQTKIGYTPLRAALCMLPIALCLLLFSRRMGGLSSRFGPKYFIAGGPLLCSLAMFLLLNYKPGDAYSTFLFPRILLFGIGMAILVAPLTTTVMTSVTDASSGVASGINNALARVAGLIVIALLGLAGAGNLYRFSIWLGGFLALFAGLASLIIIRNPQKTG